MNMDSKAAFPMPNTSSSRWRKDHATQNKFGDSNNNQANFALISGPKDQEAAEDEEGLPECFPYVWCHDAEVQNEKRGDREQCDHLGNVIQASDLGRHY